MTIDWWTLGIQTVNILILVWLLQHFFWKPVSAMIAQRKTAAQKALDDADAKDKKATASLAEIEATRAGFAGERDAILKAAHNDAEKARTASMEEDAKQAVVLKQAAAAALEKEKVDAAASWTDRSSQLSVRIAERLLAPMDAPAIRTLFLDRLVDEVRKQPDSLKQEAGASTLIMTSPCPLDAADQALYAGRIGEALGGQPKITFAVDATLIAGLELIGAHMDVQNSWRADLKQILEDLTHAG
jgi:F-type H+-transporting ATPase subunit b